MQLGPHWQILDTELEFRALRSSGPGGQHVNKTSTKIELRFRMASSQALSLAQKERFVKRFPASVTSGGDVILSSDSFRSQKRNQADVLARLEQMLDGIRRPPKVRRPTQATRASHRRRLAAKRQRSELKRGRTKAQWD